MSYRFTTLDTLPSNVHTFRQVVQTLIKMHLETSWLPNIALTTMHLET